MPSDRDSLVNQAGWPRGVPPANTERLATWSARELERASRAEQSLFAFAQALYRQKPFLLNSVLARMGGAFQEFDQARRSITDRLNDWGVRANTDTDFAKFLEQHVRRFRSEMVFLAYVEIALATALGTQTSPADNPLELGFWQLGAKWLIP